MTRLNTMGLVLLGSLWVAGGLGCEKKKEAAKPAPEAPAAAEASKPAAAAATAEQVAAYPLEVCVVTGEKLGDHGEPYDLVHEGRLVRLCCKSCDEDFKADPAKFLAQIDAAAKAKASAPVKP